MKSLNWFFVLGFLFYSSCNSGLKKDIVIDETQYGETIDQVIAIDSVWAGHPVRFGLLTSGNRQYIAYYNAERSMVVGQRDLDDSKFSLHVMPRTYRESSGGTSTVVAWDSHNSIALGVDKEGYIHLSGNMHVNPITYFRSSKPNDISTLEQEMSMVGKNETRCTYPVFMTTKEGELVFHYRDGGSGNGNEIYNIYNCSDKKWSRMLDVPLTDGQGLMNAYQSQPTVGPDGWYHVYWVWRDTPDCATNHDLSYIKSPDLKNWFDAFENPIQLPATIDQKTIIVDPIPPKGGIINLAAKLCFDEDDNPLFAYHKYGPDGNLQFYVSSIIDEEWKVNQVTNWDYRWEFSGNGSIISEVRIKTFTHRDDGNYEIDYWHVKYGDGTILLDENLNRIGKVKKAPPIKAQLETEGEFPGLLIQTRDGVGAYIQPDTRYMLKWETLNNHRDKARPKPWPAASKLYLYKLKK